MGQGLSCATSNEHELFTAVQYGDIDMVNDLLEKDPNLIHHTTLYDRHSVLHVAAANGQIEVVFSFQIFLFCLQKVGYYC